MRSFLSPLFISIAFCAIITPALAEKSLKNKSLVATIVSYECGDNCYLTVSDEQGTERVGLCAAPLCDTWNQATEMPKKFVGKKISFVIGTGQQFDASGALMGEMEAFMQIKLLK